MNSKFISIDTIFIKSEEIKKKQLGICHNFIVTVWNYKNKKLERIFQWNLKKKIIFKTA